MRHTWRRTTFRSFHSTPRQALGTSQNLFPLLPDRSTRGSLANGRSSNKSPRQSLRPFSRWVYLPSKMSAFSRAGGNALEAMQRGAASSAGPSLKVALDELHGRLSSYGGESISAAAHERCLVSLPFAGVD